MPEALHRLVGALKSILGLICEAVHCQSGVSFLCLRPERVSPSPTLYVVLV